MLVASNASAQEAKESSEPAAPNLASLQANWWSYFEGTREEVEPRISKFIDAANAEIPKLAPQNQDTARSVLQALRDNFSAYLDLLDQTAFTPEELPDPDSVLKLLAEDDESKDSPS